jgi:fatty acyl-CoA reductase
VIEETLAGRRIAVTGATGFVGTAVVERLLRSIPRCELVLLVRPGSRLSAAERTRREILRNDCFTRLRSELGDRFDAEISARCTTIAGDIARDDLGLDEAGRAALASCDIVIHAAAVVSFDAPLDQAVEVNLLGPVRVASTLKSLPRSGPLPHLIAVSTAYVNSNRKGDAAEELITAGRYRTRGSWQDEVRAARRARGDLEAASRSPERLTTFQRTARRELGAAGTSLLAQRTERLREDWVRSELVEMGRARARALGWPDAYAFTKSLGEVALLEQRGELPLTTVRPSIVESALVEPHPGWIRGFRMAEPVIISYARGLLRQFPGVPEGIIDVVPVDFVTASIIAVAANGPDPSGPSVYQIASGTRNPLHYGTLVNITHDWFTEHPIYDHTGQPIVVPEWSFPGRGRVQGQLRRAVDGLGHAERVMNSLPLRGAAAEWVASLEERRSEAERALGYVELYGAYTETEVRFRIERTLGLYESLPKRDRARFCFDPAVIDWRAYLENVHLPSVVEHARVRASPERRSGPTRRERHDAAILTSEPRAAVFDLENTLVAANVVDSYAYLASRHLAPLDRARLLVGLVAEGPRLWSLDRRDRSDFLRTFYRRYAGAPVAQLEIDAGELATDLLLARAFPEGLARVRAHRRLGHPTLLISGALDVIVEPLRPLFDEIVCASLERHGETFSSRLATAPPTGEARALLIERWATEVGLDASAVVAYADSTSDLPMLEAAGYPVAVNPEAKLAAIARRRGWPVEQWHRAPGASRRLLPLATRRVGPRTTLAALVPPAPVPPTNRGARS